MQIASTKIVVLFEHELIRAAKLLEKFAPGSKTQPTAIDAQNMLIACYSAIYSPELASGKHPVVVIKARDI